jgi:hypothetical protein
MFSKTIIAIAAATLAVAASPAHAAIFPNGGGSNGHSTQGTQLNGGGPNGHSTQGTQLNGGGPNGHSTQGTQLNGGAPNGHGAETTGFAIDGIELPAAR